MTAYHIHTANEGWLEHPASFAHIGRLLGVTIHVQADLALADHEYRVHDEGGPIGRTTSIEESSGRQIRRAIERHLTTAKDRPAPVEEPPQLHQQGKQLSLFGD
jgi:hypothetical protein